LTSKHAEVCLRRGKSEAVQNVNSVTEADKIKVPLHLKNITDFCDSDLTWLIQISQGSRTNNQAEKKLSKKLK